LPNRLLEAGDQWSRRQHDFGGCPWASDDGCGVRCIRQERLWFAWLLSVYAKACDNNKALPNVEMTVAMNLLKENLGEDLPKSDLQVVLKI